MPNLKRTEIKVMTARAAHTVRKDGISHEEKICSLYSGFAFVSYDY